MSRHDHQWVADIREAGEAIHGFLIGIDQDAFGASDLVRSAVLNKLTIIGEAANRISPEFKARKPHVPWRDIISFRNVVVHVYFTLNWDTVWAAATISVPALLVDLEREQP